MKGSVIKSLENLDHSCFVFTRGLGVQLQVPHDPAITGLAYFKNPSEHNSGTLYHMSIAKVELNFLTEYLVSSGALPFFVAFGIIENAFKHKHNLIQERNGTNIWPSR